MVRGYYSRLDTLKLQPGAMRSYYFPVECGKRFSLFLHEFRVIKSFTRTMIFKCLYINIREVPIHILINNKVYEMYYIYTTYIFVGKLSNNYFVSQISFILEFFIVKIKFCVGIELGT